MASLDTQNTIPHDGDEVPPVAPLMLDRDFEKFIVAVLKDLAASAARIAELDVKRGTD
jgi:hypothetical protein